MMRTASKLLVMLAAGVASACSEAALPSAPDEPSFTVLVSGALARQFAGPPVFTTHAEGSDHGFALALAQSPSDAPSSAPRHAVYLHRTDSSVPAAGEYAIAPGGLPFDAGLVLDADGADPIFCVAESGRVRIEQAAFTLVSGSFSFAAACAHRGGAALEQPVQVSGSFSARAGSVTVPDIGRELRPVGRFSLVSVSGRALPATVFDGIVLGDDDSFFQLEITATGGYLEIGPDGHYEHRVFQEVRIDGQSTTDGDWVDRGKCAMAGGRTTCISSHLSNITFVPVSAGGALELTQDLAGEGYPVTYRYAREGT